MTHNFVPFEITVCGIQELSSCCDLGVTHVLSILDPGYPLPGAFGDFRQHERLELRFHDIIEESGNMTAPQQAHIEQLLDFGRKLLSGTQGGQHLLVHCHMGISRSSAAMALILAQARPDRPAAEALDAVRRIRPRAWPNLRIIELGDALLGCQGALVASAHQMYRAQLAGRPELVRGLIAAGRGREAAGALDGTSADR